MISTVQLQDLSKKYKTNLTVVAREYLQLLFLQSFYDIPDSERVFFKGGTAIHFLMDGFRFSEDLDFTVELPEESLVKLLAKSIKNICPSLLLKYFAVIP